MRVDLHCHSTFSDGTLTPNEMLDHAHELNLQGLSITDHDTIDAYTPEFFQKAGDMGLIVIPGVELSSDFQGHSVHILGYGYDLEDIKFNRFIRKIQERRNRRNEEIIQRLEGKGFSMPMEELVDGPFGMHVIGRPHIAKLMVKKGYVRSIQEAFNGYLKDDGECFVAGEKFSSEEIIIQIKKAKGKAILAHPHLIKPRSLVSKLLKLPFDGLEGYYGRFPPHIEQKWVQIGKEKGWIITGGSDFHGWVKPETILGSSWIDGSVVDELLS